LVANARPIDGVALVTTLPVASSTATWTGIGAPAIVSAGATTKASAAAGPAMNCTVGCWASATAFVPGSAVAAICLASATVDLSIPVATPEISVGATGWVNRFDAMDPVASSTTSRPTSGLPAESSNVTVIETWSIPSAITPVARSTVTVDRAGSAGGPEPTAGIRSKPQAARKTSRSVVMRMSSSY